MRHESKKGLRHTPGPWKAIKDGQGYYSIAGNASLDPTTESRYVWVAKVLTTRSPNPLWRQVEEYEPNARLIAAAPDLFKALSLALDYLNHPEVQALPFAMSARTAANRCRKAIAKALGDD